jgi:hypothetical protein
VRDGGVGERAAGGELVVRRDQRPRAVEDADARSLETCELPEAGLDSVEIGRDVQSPERDVASLELLQRLSRGEDAGAGPPASKGDVGRCFSVGNERGEHVARNCRVWGRVSAGG